MIPSPRPRPLPRLSPTLALAFAFALALVVVPSAAAAIPGTPIVAGPGAWVSDYATEAAAVAVGGTLDFANADLFRHNVVARGHFGADDQPWCEAFVAGRCPLFWSELVETGSVTPVLGLDRLTATQTYTFYCTLHPLMEGTLVALPAP